MSLLLALTGQVAAPVQQQDPTGGYPLPPRRRRKRATEEEFERVFEQEPPPEVAQAVQREIIKPELSRTQRAYIDGIFAAIVRAKNDQDRARKLAAVAQAEREAAQAQMMLAQAIEAEAIARQQMMDFDIAFVAAVLADM